MLILRTCSVLKVVLVGTASANFKLGSLHLYCFLSSSSNTALGVSATYKGIRKAPQMINECSGWNLSSLTSVWYKPWR